MMECSFFLRVKSFAYSAQLWWSNSFAWVLCLMLETGMHACGTDFSCLHPDLLLSDRLFCNVTLSSLAVFIFPFFRDYELFCQDSKEVDCSFQNKFCVCKLSASVQCPCWVGYVDKPKERGDDSKINRER